MFGLSVKNQHNREVPLTAIGKTWRVLCGIRMNLSMRYEELSNPPLSTSHTLMSVTSVPGVLTITTCFYRLPLTGLKYVVGGVETEITDYFYLIRSNVPVLMWEEESAFGGRSLRLQTVSASLLKSAYPYGGNIQPFIHVYVVSKLSLEGVEPFGLKVYDANGNATSMDVTDQNISQYSSLLSAPGITHQGTFPFLKFVATWTERVDTSIAKDIPDTYAIRFTRPGFDTPAVSSMVMARQLVNLQKGYGLNQGKMFNDRPYFTMGWDLYNISDSVVCIFDEYPKVSLAADTVADIFDVGPCPMMDYSSDVWPNLTEPRIVECPYVYYTEGALIKSPGPYSSGFEGSRVGYVDKTKKFYPLGGDIAHRYNWE